MKTSQRPYDDPAMREALREDNNGESMLNDNFEQQVMKKIAAEKAKGPYFRVAASIIGVLMLSGISYAAISHLITMDSKPKVAITERKPDVKKVKKTYGIEAAPTKQAPVIYNNVELQQIMQYIADGYGVKVEYKNEATRTLRFYLQWEAEDTLQEIIDKINHFEKVHLSLNEETIIIE